MADYSVTLVAQPRRLRGLRRVLAVQSTLVALLLALVFWLIFAGRASTSGSQRWGPPLLICGAPALLLAWRLGRGLRVARWLSDHAVTLEKAGIVITGADDGTRAIPWSDVTSVSGDSPELTLATRQGRVVVIPRYGLGGEEFLLALRMGFFGDDIASRTSLFDVGGDLVSVGLWMAALFALMALPARLYLPSLSTMVDPADRYFGLLGLVVVSAIAAVTGGVVGGMRFGRVWQATRVGGGVLLPVTVGLLTVLWSLYALAEWGTRSALGLGSAVGVLGAAASEVALRISMTRQWGAEQVAREVGAVPLPENRRIRPVGLWAAIKLPLLLAYCATLLVAQPVKVWRSAEPTPLPRWEQAGLYLLAGLAVLLAWFMVRRVASALRFSFCASADALEVWSGRGRRTAVAWDSMVSMEFVPGQNLGIRYRVEAESDGERPSDGDDPHGKDDPGGDGDEEPEEGPTRWLVFTARRWRGGLLSQLMWVVQDRAGLAEVKQFGPGFSRGRPVTILRFTRPGDHAAEDEEGPEAGEEPE